MKKLLAILALLFPALAFGQYTQVSAHIQDNNGSVYQNCSFNAIFVGESSQPGPYLLSGSVFQTSVDGARCDSSGNISVTVATNSAVSPTPSQWQFNFCDQTGKYCGQATLTTTGTAQDVSAQLQAVAPLLPTSGGSNGYNTIQDEGAGLTQQHIVNFRGAGVSCSNDAGNVRTNCDISGSVTAPGGVPGDFQGNIGSAFSPIKGFTFSVPTGTESSNVSTTCVDNACTVNSGLDFNVAPASPSTLSAGANTVNFTHCPDGVNGADTVAGNNPHYILVISGGGDSAPNEADLITGGTCVSGQAGSITFNAAFAHSGGYHIGSATSGIQEAVQLTSSPNAVVNLVAHNTYTCQAPIFLTRPNMTFDGHWATLQDASFDSCLVLGNRPSFGVSSAGWQSIEVTHLYMKPTQVPWVVTPSSGAISGSNATETLTIPTCPTGFYAAIPNQILWLNGTKAGNPTSPYGVGEFVITTGTGTCTPGASSGTVQVAALAFVNTVISPHDSGFTLSNKVTPYIEDSLTQGGHIHDMRWVSGPDNLDDQFNGFGIMVENDQSAHYHDLNMDAGFWVRRDSSFQGSAIFAPGPFSTASAVVQAGPNLNISNAPHCVWWFAGNDLNFFNNICQNYTQGAVVIGTKRGGFGRYSIRDNHFEIGGTVPPIGAVVGNPCVMVIGSNKPVTIVNNDCAGNAFTGANGSPWPTFKNSAGTTQYYYLVAHNNLLSGCTSGGDCTTPPVLIGNALVTDPSADNVTVTFAAWGSGQLVSPDSNPTAYDLLRVAGTGSIFPFPPIAVSSVAVATNQSPATICNLRGLCTITDNLATGSLSSYTPVYLRSSTKRYYPIIQLLPGVMSLASNPGAANASGTLVGARGTPACYNSTEFFGKYYVVSIWGSSPSLGEGELNANFCPPIIAPIQSFGTTQRCLATGSPAVCETDSSGSVLLAAAATTLTVNTTAVMLGSQITISEDTTLNPILGGGCNTTAGRTYAVTAITPGVSFQITSSVAPITTAACLNWRITSQ